MKTTLLVLFLLVAFIQYSNAHCNPDASGVWNTVKCKAKSAKDAVVSGASVVGDKIEDTYYKARRKITGKPLPEDNFDVRFDGVTEINEIESVNESNQNIGSRIGGEEDTNIGHVSDDVDNFTTYNVSNRSVLSPLVSCQPGYRRDRRGRCRQIANT